MPLPLSLTRSYSIIPRAWLLLPPGSLPPTWVDEFRGKFGVVGLLRDTLMSLPVDFRTAQDQDYIIEYKILSKRRCPGSSDIKEEKESTVEHYTGRVAGTLNVVALMLKECTIAALEEVFEQLKESADWSEENSVGSVEIDSEDESSRL